MSLSFEVGPTLVFADVDVVDGFFTLDLDFSDTILTTEKVFLKIFVGQAGGESIELTPRTLIHSAPFAIQAQAASFADTASSAFISFDNEFTRLGDDLHVGDTNERLLINPGLSGNSLMGPTVKMQINYNDSFGGMVLNTTNPLADSFYGFAANGSLKSWFQGDNNEDTMSFLFASEAAPSFIIKPDYTLSRKLVVSGTVSENAEIALNYGGGDFYHAAPIAYGSFDANGDYLTGTSNIHVAYSAAHEHYELTVDGELLDHEEYTVSVTLTGSSPRISMLTSEFPDIIGINIFDLQGQRSFSGFSVIVYNNARVTVE